MDKAAPLPEIPDAEVERLRRSFVLREMVILGISAAIADSFQELFKRASSGTSFFHSGMTLPIWMGAGYLIACIHWREEKDKILENERLRRRGGVRRVSLPRCSYHWMLYSGLAGAALICWDLGWRHTAAADYFPLAFFIGLATFAQLMLKQRFIEIDYLAETSQPPPPRSLRRELRHHWIVVVMLALAYTQGVIKTIGVLFAFQACHYPLQKWMVERSRCEFGDTGPQGP